MTFDIGTAKSFTVTAGDGYPSPTLSIVGTLPRGVTFTDDGGGTGTLAGTPAAGTGGTYDDALLASSLGGDAAQAITITVDGAPSFTSPASIAVDAGTPFSYKIATSGGYPIPSLGVAGALPTGVTFTDNGDGTATLAGTAPTSAEGSFPITFSAAGGTGGTVTQSAQITVQIPGAVVDCPTGDTCGSNGDADSAPAITSPSSTTFMDGASGSFSVTTTGYPAPVITEAGTLPSGLTFTDNGDGTATISGTPSEGGSFPVTITAANKVNPDATQTFTIVVDEAPTFTSTTSTSFTTGTAGSFSVGTTAYPAPSLSVVGSLPSGLTFTDNGNGAGTISGTPAASDAGVYDVALMAKNASGSTAQALTVTVDAAPSITSATSVTTTVGSAVDFQVDASGFPAPSFSESGGLPSGITLSSAGLLSGTTASPGAYPVTVTATSSAGSATQSFTLDVDAAPTVTSAATATFTTGTSDSFEVTTTGSPTPSLSESGELPSGLTFTDDGDGTATISGTPASGSGGTYTAVVGATSSAGSAGQPLTITVDQAPQITSPSSTTFTVDSDGSFQVAGAGFPAATYTESGTLPAGVDLSSSGLLSGTPTSSGSFPVTFTASNAGGSATQSFTLTVSTEASFAGPTSATFTVGTAGSFEIATAGTPTPTLSETGALPSGLSFTAGSGGTATIGGTAAPGTGGTYQVAVTASSSGGSSTSDVTVTVEQAPTITSASSTAFTEGSGSAFQVTGTGFPAATYTESGTLPTGVSLAPDGQLSGVPTSAGTFPVTVTATNAGGSTTQTLTVSVDSPATLTGGASTTFVVGQSSSATFTAGGTPTSTLTEAGTLPSGLTFTDNGDGTATISGTPATGAAGSYDVAVTASNAVSSSTFSAVLVVEESPSITTAQDVDLSVGAPSTFQIGATGTPAPTFTETGALPSGLALSSAGLLSGTPTKAGTFPVTVTATNAAGSTTQDLEIDIASLPKIDIPTLDTSFDAGTAGSTTLSASGYPSVTLSEIGKLPAGLTFVDNGDGTASLSGTPAASAGGTYDIAVVAASSLGQAVAPYEVTVEAPPVFTSPGTITTTVGSTVTDEVATVDGYPTPTLSEAGKLPA
ncbi:MAG: beta strand repeat-containing protein, partial [Acidimicrobiales bacterium]